MQEYLSAGLVGGSESSETFSAVVLLAGATVVNGAAIVAVETATVVGVAIVVVETDTVVGATGGKVVDVDRCCSSSAAVRSSRISTSEELEPPHADPTNNKQSKTTG